MNTGLEPVSCTVAQATVLTGLSRTRLYELLDEGRVLSRYDGAKRLIDVASLRDFFNSLPVEREA